MDLAVPPPASRVPADPPCVRLPANCACTRSSKAGARRHEISSLSVQRVWRRVRVRHPENRARYARRSLRLWARPSRPRGVDPQMSMGGAGGEALIRDMHRAPLCATRPHPRGARADAQCAKSNDQSARRNGRATTRPLSGILLSACPPPSSCGRAASQVDARADSDALHRLPAVNRRRGVVGARGDRARRLVDDADDDRRCTRCDRRHAAALTARARPVAARRSTTSTSVPRTPSRRARASSATAARACAAARRRSPRVEGCPTMWCPHCHTFWNGPPSARSRRAADRSRSPDHRQFLRDARGAPARRVKSTCPAAARPDGIAIHCRASSIATRPHCSTRRRWRP